MKLFVIRWLDAYSEDGEWADIEEFEFHHHVQVTVGFPVAMDDYYVLVTSSVDPENSTYFQGMCIPLHMIRDVEVVSDVVTVETQKMTAHCAPVIDRLLEFASRYNLRASAVRAPE